MTSCRNFYYIAKRIKKAIIKANSAIASVKAKPRIAILKSSSFNEGFLEIPNTSAPNTVPIPIPAPASPIVAHPAPIHFAACNNIKHIFYVFMLLTLKPGQPVYIYYFFYKRLIF